VDILLEDVNHTLEQRGLHVAVSQEVREWLLEQAGVEPSTGARPLRRTIQRHIQDAVSEILISRRGESIEVIDVELVDGKLRFDVQAREILTT
jgi:ATP-dependent Clp protease ATP-binding subunit ClpE